MVSIADYDDLIRSGVYEAIEEEDGREEEEGRTIGEGSIEVFLLSPNELANRALEYTGQGREKIFPKQL